MDCIEPPKQGQRVSRAHVPRQDAPTLQIGNSKGGSTEERLARLESFMESQLRRQGVEDSLQEEEMAPPHFQLEGLDHPVYHGETSMHEDGRSSTNDRPPAMTAASLDLAMNASTWPEHEIRQLTRQRHKYATPEDGESLMDAYFCWASPTYAVVNRSVFLRKSISPSFPRSLTAQETWLSKVHISPICFYW
jgi:hypothetical protein